MLTAPVAAAGLILGYGVASLSGSRPLGGLVLAGFGLWCMVLWARRDGRRAMWRLAGVGFGAFVASHVLALATGAWPAVLLAAGVTAWVCWHESDARWHARARPTT
jgi:hypothetical protein